MGLKRSNFFPSLEEYSLERFAAAKTDEHEVSTSSATVAAIKSEVIKFPCCPRQWSLERCEFQNVITETTQFLKVLSSNKSKQLREDFYQHVMDDIFSKKVFDNAVHFEARCKVEIDPNTSIYAAFEFWCRVFVNLAKSEDRTTVNATRLFQESLFRALSHALQICEERCDFDFIKQIKSILQYFAANFAVVEKLAVKVPRR